MYNKRSQSTTSSLKIEESTSSESVFSITDERRLKRLDSKQKLLQDFAKIDEKLSSIEKRTREKGFFKKKTIFFLKKKFLFFFPPEIRRVEKVKFRQDNLFRLLDQTEPRIEKLEKLLLSLSPSTS